MASAKDSLVLGAAAKCIMPDALDNHSAAQSLEPSAALKWRGKRVAAQGNVGEVVYYRIHVLGYHRSNFAFTLTPYLDGKPRPQLAQYISRPGPPDGIVTRFDIIIELYEDSVDIPGIRVGLTGTTMEALIQVAAPSARFDLEGVNFLHEPIADTRNKQANE